MAAQIHGTTKAAILMVLLGEEASSRILRHFDEGEIMTIGREVAALGEIDPGLAEKVLNEYRERILTHREGGEGGLSAARRILTKTLPPERAAQLERALGAPRGRAAG